MWQNTNSKVVALRIFFRLEICQILGWFFSSFERCKLDWRDYRTYCILNVQLIQNIPAKCIFELCVMVWSVVARTKMFVVSKRPLFRLPSVLTTPTREVEQAVVVVAAVLALDVAKKLATDHHVASPTRLLMPFRTWITSWISRV